MRLLLIFGSIFILSIHAAAQTETFTVEYAKVANNKLNLCNIDDKVKPVEGVQTANYELTIETVVSNIVEVQNLIGTLSADTKCIEFDYSSKADELKDIQFDIYTKVTVDIIDPAEKKEFEIQRKFTFTEFDDTNFEVKAYNDGKIIQFKNGNVSPLYITVKEDNPATKTPVNCKEDKSLCVHVLDANIEGKSIQIYNAETDDIPNSIPKIVGAAIPCSTDVVESVVYNNDGVDDNTKKYAFTMKAPSVQPSPCAVTDRNVVYDINTLLKADSYIIIHNDKCEQIDTLVRDMKFLKPFDHTVEISWDVDAKNDDDPPSNEFYLEVSDNNQKAVIKKLHIDCSQDGLTTCIAYVFDEQVLNADITFNYELSEFINLGAGKSRTKETYGYVQTRQTDDEKSLKALNLNQFEINWNTNQGKLCVEDSLFKETKISQYRYELVIGFAVGKWKKHIADYIDESTICFNDFEITQLIENKLGVHFLVMKRESDTNQIVASDMITTDLIVPEISEVNDETISLEFENLNSPFLIRDEKTKNIISKNEKKIHNLAFLKSSHENKSIFNKNLVLETRKEHTQMKVHFKIPQKVNAA